MGTNKITRFLVKQEKQPAARGVGSSGQRQGTIEEMRKVQKLHKSSMCADDEELFRLLDQLAEHQPDEVIDKALKHLASYVLLVEQLERVPLAPRVKQLRQHDNPSISGTATRLVEKLRDEFTAATLRKRSKPVVKQQAKLITKSPSKQPPAKPSAMVPIKSSATLPRSPAGKLLTLTKSQQAGYLGLQKTPTKHAAHQSPCKP